MAGLGLLTELLPLPLPMAGRQLNPDEKERCVVVRKLWAANLAPLADNFKELLVRQAPSSLPCLTHALRRACVALADLAPQTVVLVVRPLLDLTVQHFRSDSNNFKDIARVLYMVASLSSHAGVKAAVLQMLTTEPYNVLLTYWTTVVTGETETSSSLYCPLSLLIWQLSRVQNNLMVSFM